MRNAAERGVLLLVYRSALFCSFTSLPLLSVCLAFRGRQVLAGQFYSHLAVVDGNDNGSDDHNQTTAIAFSACFYSLAVEQDATKKC